MGKGGGDGGAAQARADEQARQAQIREGTARINETFDSQFNDDFYGGRKNAFLAYATPQLEDQYAKARRELVFALDRGGTLDSSIRANKEAELKKLYDTNTRAVADQALGYGNKARDSVESARADLINTLNATGDSAGAVNSAMSRAKALSAPDTYSPLGQLFTTFTGALGTQAALEKAAALGGPAPRYNTGLFGASPNAVKTSE